MFHAHFLKHNRKWCWLLFRGVPQHGVKGKTRPNPSKASLLKVYALKYTCAVSGGFSHCTQGRSVPNKASQASAHFRVCCLRWLQSLHFGQRSTAQEQPRLQALRQLLTGEEVEQGSWSASHITGGLAAGSVPLSSSSTPEPAAGVGGGPVQESESASLAAAAAHASPSVHGTVEGQPAPSPPNEPVILLPPQSAAQQHSSTQQVHDSTHSVVSSTKGENGSASAALEQEGGDMQGGEHSAHSMPLTQQSVQGIQAGEQAGEPAVGAAMSIVF